MNILHGMLFWMIAGLVILSVMLLFADRIIMNLVKAQVDYQDTSMTDSLTGEVKSEVGFDTCDSVCGGSGQCAISTGSASQISGENLAPIPDGFSLQIDDLPYVSLDEQFRSPSGGPTIKVIPDNSGIHGGSTGEVNGNYDPSWKAGLVSPNDRIVFKAWVYTSGSPEDNIYDWSGASIGMDYYASTSEGFRIVEALQDGTITHVLPDGRTVPSVVPWGGYTWQKLEWDFKIPSTYYTKIQEWHQDENGVWILTETPIKPVQIDGIAIYLGGARWDPYGSNENYAWFGDSELYICHVGDPDYETCGQTSTMKTQTTCENTAPISTSVCSSGTCCCSGTASTPQTDSSSMTPANKVLFKYGWGWNDADVSYAASHFDAVVVDYENDITNPFFTYAPWMAKVKVANPNIKVYGYKDSMFMKDDTPESNGEVHAYADWEEVNAHEDWFVHDASGSRIYFNAFGGRWLMDVGNVGWQKHYSDYVNKMLTTYGSSYDGAFLDDVWNSLDIATFYKKNSDGSLSLTTVPQDVKDRWHSSVLDMIKYVKSHLPVGKKMIINTDTCWSYGTGNDYLDAADGMQIEGFYHAPWELSTTYDKIGDGHKPVDCLYYGTSNGKIMLATSGTSNKDYTASATERLVKWSYAQFLLGVNGKTGHYGWSMGDMYYSSLSEDYKAIMDTNIGDPKGTYYQSGGAYIRDFTGGKVVTNPTASTVSNIDLSGTYKTLEGTAMTSLTLGPYSGEILISTAHSSISSSLHVEGNKIKDGDGNTVVLRGVNKPDFANDADGAWFGNTLWLDENVEKEIDAMKSWGVNTVRLLFAVNQWKDNTIDSRSSLHNQEAIKRFIEFANERGMYVILTGYTLKSTITVGGDAYQDPLPYPPYQSTPGGSSIIASKQDFVNFWTSVANDLKTYPNVIFELWNEPRGTSAVLEDWLSVSQQAITAIRNTGSQNLIIVSGNDWGSAWVNLDDSSTDDLGWVFGHSFTGGNIINGVHLYSQHLQKGGTVASAYSEVDAGLDIMRYYDVAEQKPLIVSEIAPRMDVSNVNNELAFFDNALSLFNSHGISYTAWGWWSATSFRLLSNEAPSFTPNEAGMILKDHLPSSNDNNLISFPESFMADINGAARSYASLDSSNLGPSGEPSIKLTADTVRGTREVDSIYPRVSPGDRILWGCWAKTSSGVTKTIYNGARVGVDLIVDFGGTYNGQFQSTADGQPHDFTTIDGVVSSGNLASWHYTGTKPEVYLGNPPTSQFIAPFGTSQWKWIYMDFVVPDARYVTDLFGSIDYGDKTGTESYQISIAGPWIDARELTEGTVWFADCEFYIIPKSG